MKFQVYYVLILLFLCPAVANGQLLFPTNDGDTPKHEFRAVWLTTAFGLDFPSKERAGYDPVHGRDWPTTQPGTTAKAIQSQEQELIGIIETAYEIGLNAVIFQIVPRGDAFYNSERLPWSNLLTGTPGGDPGWDPLQTAIEEAHKRGMELHAWYNVGRVGNEGMPLPDQEPFHIYQQYEEWIETVDNDWWLNPGIPEAREWMTENIIEIVENYDVDAIHFDFIRYPTGGFESDPQTKSQYNPNDIDGLDDWRRDNITQFLRMVYPEIKDRKPWVKVGSTPVGHYRDGDFPWPALWGYDAVFQDSRAWLQEEVNDYIIPQVYWSAGGQPDFEALAIDWAANQFGRHVYIGKAPYVEDVRAQMSRQIDITRASGAKGSAHFRFEHIRPAAGQPSVLEERYGVHRSISAPMAWMNDEVPGAPLNLDYRWNDDQTIMLEWNEVEFKTSEGDSNVRYAIYRINSDVPPTPAQVMENGKYLAGLTETAQFRDTPEPSDEPYTYFVTALSRNSGESTPSNTIETLTPLHPEPPVASEFELRQNYPNPFSGQTEIEWELTEESQVELRVYDYLGRRVSTLVDAVQPAGPHAKTFSNNGLSSGIYLYRMTITNPETGQNLFSETRYMTVIR